MADISKDQLKKEITAILKNADLNKITAKKVRTMLEEKLDVDLNDQKKQIDEIVMDYVNQQLKKSKKAVSEDEEDDEEEENGDEEDEESEEDKKKKKAAPKRGAPARKKKAASDSDDDASGDDQASDDEYSPKKKAKPAAKKGKKKKAGSDSDSDEDWGKNKKKGGGGGGGAGKGGAQKGYTKPLTLSKDLAKLMGQDTMARHEVVKKVWAIIKERNLYDPKNKQFAICDDELQKVIGEKRFRIFGMMKYLKTHFS